MKILICGFGNIGKHIFNEFLMLKNAITLYDKYDRLLNDPAVLKSSYDYAFICVPTEKNADGACDLSEVQWIIPQLTAETIILKSAVPVGTCEKLSLKNLVVSPEFYGTTQHSPESPSFLIVGGKEDACCRTAQLYQQVKSGGFRFIFTDWRTAELAKYMENCWIAAKVTFCNEFAAAAEKFGVRYEKLRECFIADERVSPAHTFVYREQPFYDSHCLNKDIPAFLAFCRTQGIDTPLMSAVDRINTARKAAANPEIKPAVFETPSPVPRPSGKRRPD